MSNTQAINKPAASGPVYLTDVLLLCAECRQPIKARINTQQWIRVEWIGPSGECLSCYQRAKSVTGETIVPNEKQSHAHSS